MRIQRNWFEEGFAIPTSHLIYHKKHVFAIAAGIVDGMNPKAALMARRIAEVGRMGGDDGFPFKRQRLLVSKVKVGRIQIVQLYKTSKFFYGCKVPHRAGSIDQTSIRIS